jgi:carbamoyl-phosphate synthase large subunit
MVFKQIKSVLIKWIALYSWVVPLIIKTAKVIIFPINTFPKSTVLMKNKINKWKELNWKPGYRWLIPVPRIWCGCSLMPRQLRADEVEETNSKKILVLGSGRFGLVKGGIDCYLSMLQSD